MTRDDGPGGSRQGPAISLSEFLESAGSDGPAVGLWVGHRPPLAPVGIEFREISGRAMTTLDGLYDTYARAWDFPDYFGRNRDAFDECMRELDESGTENDSAVPAGYLTAIVDADRTLGDDPEAFEWFARSQLRYREHYRDVAVPRGIFAVLLETSESRRHDLIARWRRAGVAVATVATDHRR